MKINLLLNDPAIRSGYLNIDPFMGTESANCICGSITCLDEYVDDAEALEIVANHVIDYLPAPDLNGIIKGWVGKLRHGGIITIGGIDLHEVAKAYLFQQIDIGQANALLYGSQTASWDYRKATLTLQHMIGMMSDQGLKVIAKRSENFHYYVTGKRP